MNSLLSLGGVMSKIGAIAMAVFLLLFMVMVHEFGHYIAGKIFKFKIEEFSIGFGPAIFKKKNKSGELISLRALPLGGFCAFEGEDEEGESENSFNKKSPWKRIIVLIAGGLMNIITAWLIIVLLFSCYGQSMLKVGSDGGTGEYIGYSLQENDIIKSVNGREIYITGLDINKALNGKDAGDIVKVEVYRKNAKGKYYIEKIDLKLRSDVNVSSATGSLSPSLKAMGVRVTEEEDGKYYVAETVKHKHSFFSTLGRSFVYVYKIVIYVYVVLGELIMGKLSLKMLGGPVTTIKMTSEMATYGFDYFLEIGALIGANLGVFNLLPFPALDGARVVFCGIEGVRKKPVSRKVESIIHFAGLIFLFGFAILVDLLQFI